MNDFTNYSSAGLASQLEGLSPEQLIKIASDQAVARIRAEEALQSHTVGRVKASKALVVNTIDSIVKVSQAAALYNAGVLELDDDAARLLQARMYKASEDAEAIADAVAEGDQAEQQLVAGLVEAAAQDPAVAAEMISDAGDDMDEEEVLEAASDLADVTEAEEMGQDGEKMSSAPTAAFKSSRRPARP